MSEQIERTADRYWQQLLSRDACATFVYGVTTTGVFCRPACPSRRPARANVRFFAAPHQASAAGFRACLRCRPCELSPAVVFAERIAAYLREHLDRQVSLGELGRMAGASPFTIGRVFRKIVGMSPRTYANALRAEQFRSVLQDNAETRITDAVYEAGFSAPSRAAHAAPLGMAAKRYRTRGAGERIAYTIADAPAPLGRMLVATTERGVCAVLLGEDEDALRTELARRFRAAELTEDDAALAPIVHRVLGTVREPAAARELALDLRGTAFQARVWAALQQIPTGETRTYLQLAESLGNRKAVRAVAQACGANPAAIVVPCHRVVGSDGSLTGYRWGVERKRMLLAREKQAAGMLEPQSGT